MEKRRWLLFFVLPRDKIESVKQALEILSNALAEKQFTAAAFRARIKGKEVSHYLGHTAQENTGAVRREVSKDSLFDLASLTKILSTVHLLLIAESEGRLFFKDSVTKYVPEFPHKDVDLMQLMEQRSGLVAHREFFKRVHAGEAPLGDQKMVLRWIAEEKLGEKKFVYSDLNYILLGKVVEAVYGGTIPQIFREKITAKLKLEHTGFVTLPHAVAEAKLSGMLAEKQKFVATESCPWRQKVLQGEVHDDNCWVMGGYAGHAGLFSTADETLKLLESFWRQVRANPTTWPLPDNLKTLPAGSFYRGMMVYPGLRAFPNAGFPGALGHTGYTGTSAWVHPETDSFIVLLTNRVHPSRKDDRFIDTRLRFHQALWEEL